MQGRALQALHRAFSLDEHRRVAGRRAAIDLDLLVACLHAGNLHIVRQDLLADVAAVEAEHVGLQRHGFAFFWLEHHLRLGYRRAPRIAHEAEVSGPRAFDVVGRVVVIAPGEGLRRPSHADGQRNCTDQHIDLLTAERMRMMLAEPAAALKPPDVTTANRTSTNKSPLAPARRARPTPAPREFCRGFFPAAWRREGRGWTRPGQNWRSSHTSTSPVLRRGAAARSRDRYDRFPGDR